jgi:membrane protease YdiL (CAAX protease family)
MPARPRLAEHDWQALHGGLLIALLLVPAFVRPLQHWPWYLAVPLGAYLVLVAALGPLRRTVRWNRVGRLGGAVLAATGAISAVSAAALLLYDAVFRPDLEPLSRQLPLGLPLPVPVTGLLFAVVNALLEEVIFRGVLQDALAARVGTAGAVVLQAVAFGVGHAHGYPPGTVGIGLAMVYGILLGALRHRAGGLLAPWLAHVCADATIFGIVAAGGVPPLVS